jgi:DNA-binding MarR family transcriptional regulator
MHKSGLILFEIKSLSHLAGRQIEKALVDDCADNPTGMQGIIIGYLSRNIDRDTFQRDIEAEYQIRRSTATGILQLMEKNGLIERHAVEQDARLKKLVLTQKAVNLQEHVMHVIHGIERQAESGLTEDEITMFLSTLHKIKKSIG